MSPQPFTRRGFLKASGGVIAGTLAAASGAIGLLAPSRSWALELTTLDTPTGKVLLVATRHIFPHSTLDDAVYALVVKDLDAAASGDESVAGLLQKGVADLNEASGSDWLSLPKEEQLEILSGMADSAFFQKIRGTAVVSLYNNELAFAHFGYEGPSFVNGGYLHRGFNDLNWLPDPSPEASPDPA